ncbi:hypothetical protein Ga0074812_12524 [Parafrankia irregularis]|uniref:Uncharacterized protein n=1 Tax=Parafrankia irregularis TaxID=795642 RepID=A0A0S4QVG0_9ACTN|nr:hypothetical protein Ga0074812_12524 [Parafrankia irregularis]
MAENPNPRSGHPEPTRRARRAAFRGHHRPQTRRKRPNPPHVTTGRDSGPATVSRCVPLYEYPIYTPGAAVGISASTTAVLALFNGPTRAVLIAAVATSTLVGAGAVVVIGRLARAAR